MELPQFQKHAAPLEQKNRAIVVLLTLRSSEAKERQLGC